MRGACGRRRDVGRFSAGLVVVAAEALLCGRGVIEEATGEQGLDCFLADACADTMELVQQQLVASCDASAVAKLK